MEKLYKIQGNNFQQILAQQQPPPANKQQVRGKEFALFFYCCVKVFFLVVEFKVNMATGYFVSATWKKYKLKNIYKFSAEKNLYSLLRLFGLLVFLLKYTRCGSSLKENWLNLLNGRINQINHDIMTQWKLSAVCNHWVNNRFNKIMVYILASCNSPWRCFL